MMLVGSYVREVLDRASRASGSNTEVQLPPVDARSQKTLFERFALRLVSGRFSRYPR
jgi:hypothetical protein